MSTSTSVFLIILIHLNLDGFEIEKWVIATA